MRKNAYDTNTMTMHACSANWLFRCYSTKILRPVSCFFYEMGVKYSIHSLIGVTCLRKLLTVLLGTEKTKKSLLRAFPTFCLFTGAILFWELLMHTVLFREVNGRIVYVVLFSIFFGLVLTVLTSCLNKTASRVLIWAFLGILYLWYAAQLVYFQIFGGLISLHLVQMGGEAVTNFFKETMRYVLRNLWLLIIMAIPFATAAVLLKKRIVHAGRRSAGCLGRLAVLCVLLHLVCLGSLTLGGTGSYTAYDAYHSVNTATETSVSNLGFLTTFRLELKYMLSGAQQEVPPPDDLEVIDPSVLEDILSGGKLPTVPTAPTTQPPTTPKPTEVPGQTDPTPTEPPTTVPTEPPVLIEDQVMQIDFDALIAQSQAAGNDTLTTLHRYFAAQTPTRTNDFTGLFEGKNLIYLVCESFSPEVISPELTPTLYKLSTEGIVFTNFYGSFRSVTTNGEYTACMGLFPDMSRSKKDGSFAASIDNYLPFALGNIFESQKGVPSYGYHNYKGTYYRRNETHPNMGYTCKFMNDGMKFTYGWPSSDYEMMQQSVHDYVNQERFHAYYMTFSGHYMYDYKENPMCRINRDAVSHLTYSEPVCAYIACHLELEKGMAYLMEQLELAGQLENTVIVMTSDHYPYGLTEKQYSELAGEKKSSNFGIYENAFICWSYGMEDPIVVDTPCFTVDILPTLLNLFGFEYDSRLLSGKDVLDPSARHIAILHNGSFITDYVRFDSGTGKTTYLVDKSLVPEGYVDALVKLVQNEFTISKAILDQDYYRVVLG